MATDITNTFENPDVGMWGSCDPTTWRGDILIPHIQKLGITSFNPQRSDWTPERAQEFSQQERRALDTSKVNFFVIDPDTRALVSILELYHIIFTGKVFIAVIQDLVPGSTIAGQVVTQAEADLINGEREMLRQAITTLGLNVFATVEEAMIHIPLALTSPEKYRIQNIETAAQLLGYNRRKPMSQYHISENAFEALGDILTAVSTAYMAVGGFTVYFPDCGKWSGLVYKDDTVFEGRRLADWMRLVTPYAYNFVLSGQCAVEVVYQKG